MFYFEESFFPNLRTIKQFYDAGCIDRVLNSCGKYTPLDFEIFELAWEILDCVFEDTRVYFNDKKEIDAYVFCDPLIDEFCSLMLEYEKRHDLPLGDNDYRNTLTQDIYDCFEFNYSYYDYAVKMYSGIHGRGRLVLLTGCEFCEVEEIPNALAFARNVLTAQVRMLRKELEPKLTVIDGGLAEKEAA